MAYNQFGINPAAAIAGSYFDANFVGHGFLRTSGGTITTFDPPGSTSTAVGPGGQPFAGPFINPAGAITGHYFDASGAIHGFLRAPDGTFTIVDPPGSAATNPSDINPAGAITGFYLDASGAAHGFLRSP